MVMSRLKDYKRSMNFKKLCLVLTLIGVLVVGGLNIYKKFSVNVIRSKVETQLDSSKVVTWLNALLSHSYEQCDIISYDKIETPNWVEYMDSYTEISSVMDGLVDCIESTTITNQDLNRYTIEVTFTPYKKVSEISIDKAYLTDLGDNYANNNLYSSELQSELDKIYVNAFKDTVFAKDLKSEKVTVNLTLSESDVNGVTLVYGTRTFINTLLSDSNILSNLKFYEENIKSTVEQYLVNENQI